MNLPSRLTWAGTKSESTFSDLKIAQGHLNAGFLTSMLQVVGELQKQSGAKESQILSTPNIQKLLKQTSQTQNVLQKSLFARIHSRPGYLTASMRREVELAQFSHFKRMKTVFCHADHSTDEVSSIFNVQFDRTGRFIISGADDGILKVWDRDTLTLQASLHGHFDFITDIDISKCNRFIASAGKDAQVIIWDLKMGRIVKRLTSHQNLINRLLFVAPRVQTAATAAPPSEVQLSGGQAIVKVLEETQNDPNENDGSPATTYVKDQFLLTCSDDGTVHLYDFSPFSRVVEGGQSQKNSSSQRNDYDEMRIRRSGRRSTDPQQACQNARDAEAGDEVFIFDVALTPDDYRPGTRNKKLDAVACSSAGIVVAGTSTGEILCWKLNFQEISRRSKQDCSKCLGQFKVCKNAGVQFAEFSPIGDLLMTGSTDGSVKIWRLEISPNKATQHQELKNFSMSDNSRLVVTIDEKNGCEKTNSISYFDEQGAEVVDYQQVKQPVSGQIGFMKMAKEIKFSKSQCDAVKWSINGRFAIASITSQIEDPRGEKNEEYKEEVCRIKIWDTINETFYDDLARPSGHQLKKNSWVIAPHPIFEELLMTGSDGGTLILWNIERKQILQKFSQYGVYSIDGYVRDNPLDGKFSSDGKAFIVGNQLGTISLYSCESVEHQYEATRVQQFFMYDRARNNHNPFERIENRPQICGYNMIPHEAQPAKPCIGKFLSDDQSPVQNQHVLQLTNVTDDEEEKKEVVDVSKKQILEKKKIEAKKFERKLITAKELGQIEEKYYRDQLNSCLQETYLPNVLEQGHQLDFQAESSIEVLNGFTNQRERQESVYGEQSPLVNALSQSPRRINTNARTVNEFSTPSQNQRQRAQATQQRRTVGTTANPARGNVRRRLVRRSDGRTLRDMPDVLDYDSEELIADGYANSPQSLYHADSQDEDSASEASDIESSPEVIRQRFNVRRANVHEAQNPQSHEEEQRNRRAERMSRRQGVRDPDTIGISTRRTAGGDIALGNDIHFDVDDEIPIRRRGRGRPSNAERERLARFQQRQPDQRDGSRRRIISDASQDAHMDSADAPQSGRLARRRLLQNNRADVESSSSPEQQMEANRNLTRRNGRRLIDNSSNSRASRTEDIEERKGNQSPSKAEKSHNQIIRESGFFLSDKEEASAYNFDKMLNNPGDESNEKGKKTMTTADLPDTQPDQDYKLVENPSSVVNTMSSNQQVCAFCQKQDEPLVGPFCKFDENEKTKVIGSPLYFHQDCIELNYYSKFSIESKMWVNIGKALESLVHREQFTCYRCQTKGATVQCRDCAKSFHGFKCAKMYALALQDEEGRPIFQCIFCRNTQNWEDRISDVAQKQDERKELEREGLLHERAYLRSLRTINKDHLLSSQGYAQWSASGQSYSPQLNDFVYYFFQGHEYYMSQYSCHYFCGQLEKFPRQRFMPWHKHPKIKKREFVRCRVDAIEVLFPSQRSLNLLDLYGKDCTQVTQTAQIIQRITLSVLETQAAANTNNQIKFQVDIFPNALPDFLIHQAIFNEKYERYRKALQTGIVDKTFKVFLKEYNVVKTMRIIADNCPLEPTLYPNSLWCNIKCVELNQGRSGQGRVTEMPQHRSTRSQQTQPAQLSEDDCERISFWDIQFGNDEVQAISKAMQVFVPDEKAKLFNTLKDFMEKKKEYLECFMDRVPLEVAPDYRSIIPAEMFFNLIKDRINNGYYRSQEQLLSDIDLISYNAKIYNGEIHEISLNAKELCELVRVTLKRAMFTKSDTLMQQQMQAGKLTMPSRLRTSLQQKTEIDEMRHNLHQDQRDDHIMMEIPSQRVLHQETIINTGDIVQSAPSSIIRLTRNSNAAQLQQAVQESKNQLEEEKMDSAIVQISIRQNETLECKDKKSQKEATAISGKASEQAQSRQSNNMGRRRNRINAGMATAEELEEKTRTDAASPSENEDQSGTKRITRNGLRKRQRLE